MSKIIRLFPLTLLIAASFSTWITLDILKKARLASNNKPTNPDMFMRHAVYKKIGEDGKLQQEIRSPEIKHYTFKDSSKFLTPHIVIYNDKTTPWVITSDQGNSTNGTKTVNLVGNVKFDRKAGPHNSPTTLTTSKATFYPKNKLAKTDQPVTMRQPGNTVNAVGVEADLAHGKIRLLSKVKDYLIPTTLAKH